MIALFFFLFLSFPAFATNQPETDWTEVDLTAHTAPVPQEVIEEPLLLSRPFLYGSIEESCSPDNVKILVFGIVSGSLITGAGVLYYWLGVGF